MQEGRIIKALSGFYYVQTESGVHQCRGRGVFRIRNISPLVGDYVKFEIDTPDEGYILEVEDRTNELVRPPIANIDQAIIVSAAIEPAFSSLLLDQFLVLIESKDIEPIIFITKTDLASPETITELENYQNVYEKIGYTVKLVSTKKPLEHILPYLKDKVSVIAGQSGVGKTSLLNALSPGLLLKTDEISKSLGRGKHTTRHVELIEVAEGLIADTPGFSTLDFSEIEVADLSSYFPEMVDRQHDCKFRGCLHHKEPKCAVKAAVENEEIATFRYEHYLRFLQEIQSRKPRY